MMTGKRTLLLFAVMLPVALAAMAGKPRWVGNTPKELNDTYRFVEVVSYGKTIQSARLDAQQQLAQNEQLRRAVLVSIDAGKLSNIDQTMVDGKMTEKIDDKVTISMQVKGQEYRLQGNIVDEYIERINGSIRLHTLYMVAVCSDPVFDKTYLSTSYGAAPVAMSIIPGLGQIYKGSTLKGILMFGGTALCAGAALLCENQRSDYKNKMHEQPRFAQDYNTKANNWETSRNVCLGAAAAVWVYNIIDAAAAKGARKVNVRKTRTFYWSLNPSTTLDGVMMSFNYQF